MENIELTLRLKGILKIPTMTKINFFYDLVQKEIDSNKSTANVKILLQVLSYHKKKTCCKCSITHLQKYRDFYSHYNNTFFSEKVKDELMHVFGKIQKTYLALGRFAYIWKIKHATPANTFDIFLNEIDPTKSYILTIYQSKKLFYFTVKDFMNIVQRALCNAYGDFSIASLPPKNPYNKEVFKLHHFYHAYFQMRYKMGIEIPEVFQRWAHIGFSLKLIDKRYMAVLQKYAIKIFIWNVDITNALYIKDIKSMFFEYAVTKHRILIDEDFPHDVLIEKTRSYMYVFYLMKFVGLDESLYDYYDAVLIQGLRELAKFNPAFGRKQILIPRGEKNKKRIITGEDKKTGPTTLVYAFNSATHPFETRHL